MSSLRPKIAQLTISALLCLCLGGCAGRTAFPLTLEASAANSPDIAAKHEIFVSTTRERAEDPSYVFSGDRGSDTSFARIDVTVPKIHKAGAVERARGKKPNPALYFTPTQIALYKEQQAFSRDLTAQIRKNGGRALVFVHGFNTSFDAAVYRTTQIVHDSGYDGAPVLFAWASAGRTLDYVYDNNSAIVARDNLEATLRLLKKAGAQRIDIIAHSMGTWLTMEALRQLAISGDRDLGGKIRDIIFASPDIDVDVFRSQMKRYGKPKTLFALLLSRDDHALWASSVLAGNRPRVGGYDNDAELAELGVTVVDLTSVRDGRDRLNHTKFADNPALIRMLGEQLGTQQGLGSDAQNPGTVEHFGTSLGQTVVSAAQIVVTTPFEVINVVLDQ